VKYRLKPIVRKVVSLLEKEGFFVERMRGDHIIINKTPSLRRPIVLVNVKKPSNIVRPNLLSACHEAEINEEIIRKINDLLRY
jgi:predicted RNA binding protein YcfA (HicA-like mRNA interferase family)